MWISLMVGPANKLLKDLLKFSGEPNPHARTPAGHHGIDGFAGDVPLAAHLLNHQLFEGWQQSESTASVSPRRKRQ